MLSLTTKLTIAICCYTASGLFALTAAQTQKTLTADTLEETILSIQQAMEQGSQPVIAAEEQRHPYAPLFLGLSIFGGLGGTASLAWALFGKGRSHEQDNAAIVPQLPQLPAAATATHALPPASTPQHSQGWQQTHSSAAASPQTTNQNTQLVSPQYTQQQPIQPTTLTTDPTQLPFEQRRQWFYETIANSDDSWILGLLKVTPLLVWGVQRSGKSELAYCIALLRKLFLGHDLEIVDPHAHLNQLWHQSLPVYGSGNDYVAVNKRIIAYHNRIKNRTDYPQTTLWDEFTHYKDNCNCEKLIKSFLSESAKTEEYALFVAHGRTSEFLGGTEGCARSVEQGCVMLYVQAVRDQQQYGDTIPLGKGTVEGLTKKANGQNETVEIAIRPWMTGSYIQNLFPEMVTAVPNRQNHTSVHVNANTPQGNHKPVHGVSQAVQTTKSPFHKRRRFNLRKTHERSQGSVNSNVEQPESSLNQEVQPANQNLQFTPRTTVNSSTPPKTPSQRVQTAKRFIELKCQGCNKADTIMQLWGITKGGSEKWKDASAMYDQMGQEYQDFISGKRSIDELE